jgi:hypothetical protein
MRAFALLSLAFVSLLATTTGCASPRRQPPPTVTDRSLATASRNASTVTRDAEVPERDALRLQVRVAMIGGSGVVPSGVDPTSFDRVLAIVDLSNDGPTALRVDRWTMEFFDEQRRPLRRVREVFSVERSAMDDGGAETWQRDDGQGRRWLVAARWSAFGEAGVAFDGVLRAETRVRVRLNGLLTAAPPPAARSFTLCLRAGERDRCVSGDVDSGTWPTG